MEKQFIHVIFVTFCVIFFENNAQLTSPGMLGDSFETYDGNTMRKIATTIKHEFFKTQYMEKVENRSSYSPFVQNYSESNLFISKGSLLEKDANEIHDKDYSGDVGMDSTFSFVVLMGREVTMTPLTAKEQYFTDGNETDRDAYSEDGTTWKTSKNSEISGDLHSEVVTDFDFSGNLLLETYADIEQSGDLSEEFFSEMAGSTSSGEGDLYFVADSKGLVTNSELDLGARSTKQEFPAQMLNVEETKVIKSNFSSDNELLDSQDSNKTLYESEGVNVSNWVLPQQRLKNNSNVENNSYISAIPKDADNYKNNPIFGSSVMPTKFRNLGRRTRSTVSGFRNDRAKGKVTAELLSVASAANHRRRYYPKFPVTLPSNRMSSTPPVNRKSYKASQVSATVAFHRSSSASAAKRENYKASKVPSTMASTFSREIDSGKILLGPNEVVLNARPDNALQDLYLQNVDKTSQRILGYANVPVGKAATEFKKSSTSYSSEYSRHDELMDEQKSRAVIFSTSPLKVKTSTKDYVSHNGVESPFNSSAAEPSARLFYTHEKLLMVCSAIFILLLGVAAITVIFIRGYRGNRHMKNCCTRTGIHVEESRCEDSSIPLSEVVIHSRTDPPKMEHAVVDREECNLWVAPLNA